MNTDIQSPVRVELNYRENEKVKISPAGEVTGIDGRTFKIDAEFLVNSIKNNKVHIPLEEGHWSGPAAGWFDFNSFEVRDDGIYASLELTQKGKTFIDNKEYRYLSPAYYMGENRVVTGLDSVGLVNKPNLLTKALNERTTEENMTDEEIKKLKEENSMLKNELKETAEALEKKAKELKELKIARAIEKNEILPAQKEFALSLSDEELGKFIEANKTAVEQLKKKTEHEDNASRVDEETAAFAMKLGLSEEQVKKYV